MISMKMLSLPQIKNPLFWTNSSHFYPQTPTLSISLSSISKTINSNANTLHRLSASFSDSDSAIQKHEEEAEEEEEYQVIAAIRSNYNEIVIVDTAKARMLLLDSTHNVHSILNKDQKWTGSYWDEFASLPAIIPKGPIAILGLGGGTAAHLMLDLWPSLQLEGWEIDPILIDKAREYFGLSDLENHTVGGGILDVRIGNALAPSQNNLGKYAGIIIDLFCEGEVLPQLQEPATWLDLKHRLMPGGRFMVNCGGNNENLESVNWVQNSTVKALSEALPGQVSWKRMPQTKGANYLALTGPLPDFTFWSSKLPRPLSETVSQWRPCHFVA